MLVEALGAFTLGTQGAEAADGPVLVTGVSATGQIGSVVVPQSVVVAITSGPELLITSAQGDETVLIGPDVPVSGFGIGGILNSVEIQVDTSIDVTGVAATGQQGAATVNVAPSVPVIGVFAVGMVGEVTVATELNVLVIPTGIAAAAEIGTALVWSPIPEGPDGQWVEIVT